MIQEKNKQSRAKVWNNKANGEICPSEWEGPLRGEGQCAPALTCPQTHFGAVVVSRPRIMSWIHLNLLRRDFLPDAGKSSRQRRFKVIIKDKSALDLLCVIQSLVKAASGMDWVVRRVEKATVVSPNNFLYLLGLLRLFVCWVKRQKSQVAHSTKNVRALIGQNHHPPRPASCSQQWAAI